MNTTVKQIDLTYIMKYSTPNSGIRVSSLAKKILFKIDFAGSLNKP